MDNQDKETRQAFELEETPPPKKSKGKRGASSLNKRTSYIMLLVLFAAMALIVVSQLGGDKEPPVGAPVVDTKDQERTPAQGEAESAPAVQGKMPGKAEGLPSGAGTEPSTGSDAGPVAEQPGTAGMAGQTVPQEREEPRSVGAMQGGATAASEQVTQKEPEQPKPAPLPAQAPQAQPSQASQAEPVAKPAASAPKVPKAPVVPAAPSAAESEKAPVRKTSPPVAESKPAGPKNQLQNIKIKVEHAAVILDIITVRPIGHYKFFSLPKPQRMVVDLLGAFKPHAPEMKVPQNNYVGGLRIGDHSDKLRIVADIKAKDPLKMNVERISDKQVRLTITR